MNLKIQIILFCILFFIIGNKPLISIETKNKVFIIISKSDCISCNFSNIKRIKNLINKYNHNYISYFVLTNNVNNNDLDKIKKIYKIDELQLLKNTKYLKNRKYSKTPYIMLIDKDDQIIFENYINEGTVTKVERIFAGNIIKETNLFNKNEGILNINKVIIDSINNQYLFIDDLQNKIYSLKNNDTKIKLLFSIDNNRKYYENNYSSFDPNKFYEKSNTKIIGVFLDKENKNSINIIIQYFYLIDEVKNGDSTIIETFKFFKTVLDSNYQEKTYEISLNPELNINFFNVIYSNEENYITGSNFYKFNKFPYYEDPDSTFLLFKINLKDLSINNSFLPIKLINDMNQRIYYTVFTHQIIKNNNSNDFVLFSDINSTLITFKIIDSKASNIKKINTNGHLKEFIEGSAKNNPNPLALLSNNLIYKTDSKYFLNSIACYDGKIASLLVEYDSDHKIKNKAITQFYDFNGNFLYEKEISFPKKNIISKVNMIGMTKDNLIFICEYEEIGWILIEHYYN